MFNDRDLKKHAMPELTLFDEAINSLDDAEYKVIKCGDNVYIRLALKTIKSQTEISKITGLAISTVSRILQNGFEPYKTNARYFSDIVRDAEWFNGL